jgi:hypothetical protein
MVSDGTICDGSQEPVSRAKEGTDSNREASRQEGSAERGATMPDDRFPTVRAQTRSHPVPSDSAPSSMPSIGVPTRPSTASPLHVSRSQSTHRQRHTTRRERGKGTKGRKGRGGRKERVSWRGEDGAWMRCPRRSGEAR